MTRNAGRKRRRKNQRFLVKVQVSLFPPMERVLIYTEDRFVQWEGDASKAMLRFLADRPRRYAFAHLTKGGKVSLDGYAPEQDW